MLTKGATQNGGDLYDSQLSDLMEKLYDLMDQYTGNTTTYLRTHSTFKGKAKRIILGTLSNIVEAKFQPDQLEKLTREHEELQRQQKEMEDWNQLEAVRTHCFISINHSQKRLQDKISTLEEQNRALKQEINALHERSEQREQDSEQTHEASKMLQEAHRSLVDSNQHLLKEIQDLKVQHAQEALQWQKNFQEIKKLASLAGAEKG